MACRHDFWESWKLAIFWLNQHLLMHLVQFLQKKGKKIMGILEKLQFRFPSKYSKLVIEWFKGLGHEKENLPFGFSHVNHRQVMLVTGEDQFYKWPTLCKKFSVRAFVKFVGLKKKICVSRSNGTQIMWEKNNQLISFFQFIFYLFEIIEILKQMCKILHGLLCIYFCCTNFVAPQHTTSITPLQCLYLNRNIESLFYSRSINS